MKKLTSLYLFGLCWLFIPFLQRAQTKELDSLQNLLRTKKSEDTAKVNLMMAVAARLLETDTTEAQKLTEEIKRISAKLKYQNGTAGYYLLAGDLLANKNRSQEALALYKEAYKIADSTEQTQQFFSASNEIGISYIRRGSYDSARIYFESGFRAAKRSGSLKNVADAQVNLGLVCNREGNYKKSLEFFYDGLKAFERLKDDKGLSRTFNNIGLVYFNQSKFKEAIVFFKKSLNHYLRYGDSASAEYAGRVANIAEMYVQMNDFASALPPALESYQLRKKLNIEFYVMSSNQQLGAIYTGLEQFEKAEFYYLECERSAEQNNNEYMLGNVDGSMANLYIKLKSMKKARFHAERSERIAEKLGDLYILKNAYNDLYEINKAENKLADALRYHELFVSLRDSLINTENKELLKTKELTFEFEKKDAEQKAKHEQEIAVKQEELKRNQIIIWYGLGGLCLLLCLVFVILRSNNQKKEANKLLARKNEIIEERGLQLELKNKQITDSINYAQYIQKALLTSESTLKELLPEHFILFKPKDIVSGDFFWANRIPAHPDRVIVCLGDCTGHGVPGAFMSLLNISYLNEAVVQNGLSKPAEILEYVRSSIVKALNPEGSETRSQDGMDAILLLLDKNNQVLEVCGANNALVLVRQGELMKLAVNKFHVGLSYDDKPQAFLGSETELKRGDMLYLSSDGFKDQFGGPKGKKYKAKNLEDFYLKISDKACTEQGHLLEKEFETWRGSMEQMDDVCLMGIRV